MAWNLLKLLRTDKCRRRQAPRRARLQIEDLEQRVVMTATPVATINVAQPGRVLSGQLIGVNTPGWDAYLNSNPGDSATSTPDAQTVQLIKSAGLNLLRLSYGRGADDWHFNQQDSDGQPGSAALEGNLVEATDAAGAITINYGTGSPQEGAAYVAYLEGIPNDNTALGQDAQGQDWKTVSFWAGLRSQVPLGVDDGLNFLRDSHPAPFNIHYFEVGNEVYFAGWDAGAPGARPFTDPNQDNFQSDYSNFVASFSHMAREIDPLAQVGVSLGNPIEYDSWNTSVLGKLAAQNFTPDFISDHLYLSDQGEAQDGGFSDQDLLLHTVSDPTSVLGNHADCPANWASRDGYFRSLLQNVYGAQGNAVQLFALEFNSDASSATDQSYGLVHGLLFADSIGALLTTSYAAYTPWDLRTDGPLLGNTDATAYTPYPAYFAEQLGSHLVQSGDQVLPASSDTPALAVYATERPDGTVEVMLINKSQTDDDKVTFNIAGFTPGGTARSWQYGQAGGNALAENDNVALQVSTGADGLAHFQFAAPAYSMTVLELTSTAGQPVNPPTVAQPAQAAVAVVTGTQVGLSVLGSDAAGEASLTYTWTTVNAPAGVAFNANGSNAAKNTTVTFTAAGTYIFKATITSAGGASTSSSVTVTINQTLTSIVVSPGSASLGTGASQQFTAQALDQFGNALTAQPAVTWSVASGVGTIGPDGVYQAPADSGSAVVKAIAGGVGGSATVTISAGAGVSALVSFADVDDWGTGFTGDLSLTNTGNAALNGWTLEFDFTGNITDIWDAQIVSHVGNHYVIQGAAWDAAIAPGQSIDFGFNADWGADQAAPVNYLLNGNPISQI
jgi:hypothetical protein